MNWLTQIEGELLFWIQNIFSCPFLDRTMPFISWLGNKGMIWILIAITLILAGKKTRKWGFLMLFSLAAEALLINVVMKPMIARERPFDTWMLDILVSEPHDFSFPSGHASAAFCAAVTAFFMNRKFGMIMFVFAFLMAFSRLYLLVHYPTDVLAGAILGAGTSLFVGLIFLRYWKKRAS